MKEIYWNTTLDMLLLEDLSNGNITRFDQLPHSFFIEKDKKVHDDYSEQYEELCELIGRGKGFEYGRFYQFSACNFSMKDGYPDIDDDGNFILERVSCPVRHLCKRITCNCKISGKLSSRELQVISLFTKGFTEEDLGHRLFISKATVHNHINNIYAKLDFSGPNPDRQLVAYAFKNKLVN